MELEWQRATTVSLPRVSFSAQFSILWETVPVNTDPCIGEPYTHFRR